jgi:Na+/melibiose symporter-like transporter
MFFGTGVLGIPGILMGLAVCISTIWDASTDPFVGHWSDKVRSRLFGKRHGFILIGGLMVAVTNLILWSINPAWSVGVKFWVLLLLLLIMETFNTCYSTPYGALGLDISKDYNDRTAVQNFKTAFSFLSLIVPSVLMGVLIRDYRDSSGYFNIAVVTSLLCLVCAVVCVLGTYRYRHGTEDEAKGRQNFAQKGAVLTGKPPVLAKKSAVLAKKSAVFTQEIGVSAHENGVPARRCGIFEDFFSILKQKNIGRLIAGYAVSLSAGAFLTSLGLHVFTYTFHFSTAQIPIIMVCLICGIIVGQPAWYVLSRRTDKVTALVSALGMLLLCMMVFVTVLIFRSLVPVNLILGYVCFAIFLSGIATGCLYSLPISMFADCIAKHQQETGVDKTGKSAGFLTFCTKISNAVILFVIGLSLDIIGFDGGQINQPTNVQNWLGYLLVAGVSIAAVAAMFIYSKYSYTKEDFDVV